MSHFRFGVLRVGEPSDLAEYDAAGTAVCEALGEDGNWEQKFYAIAKQDQEVHSILSTWISSGEVNCIFTVGGTGFGADERTPEIVASFIERPAPGLVHLIISSSLQKTPYAAVSRPVAGTCRNTLLITLPGSVKAVRENIGALMESGLLERIIFYMIEEQ